MRQVLAAAKFSFRGFWKNPRVVLTFLLGFVLSYLLSTRIMVVMEAYHTPVQAVEPFLWILRGQYGRSIFKLSFLLLLLLLIFRG